MDNSKEIKIQEKLNSYQSIFDENKIFITFIFLYFFVNLLFLCKFPFMHSDESWLSGLSRNMIENKSFIVTENFFDLYPRSPHAIKIVFHALQSLFISSMGYGLFSVRLMSLIFGCLSLFMLYKVLSRLSDNKLFIFLCIFALAFDIQFIYISHLARQEIILVFFQLISFYYFFKHKNNFSVKNSIFLAIIIGLSIGIHPNSFIIALATGLMLFVEYLQKKLNMKHLIAFVIVLGSIATIFIILSLYFNMNFVANYSEFGSTLGVSNSPYDKIKGLKDFYLKLYYGISGTYYMPKIGFQLIGVGILTILGVIVFFIKKKVLYGLIGIIGVNIGYIIIGRYGQPSIVFIFIYGYLLLFEMLSDFNINNRYINKNTILIIICIIIFIISFPQILDETHNDYSLYLKQIEGYVPRDSTVLANLNLEYYFDNGKLFDYRNLQYLDKNKIDFNEYMENNNIEYIIYPEEMDFIYESRPLWNILYGNIYPYYEEMQKYFINSCQLVGEFKSSYAMRISKYMYDKAWTVKIYKVVKTKEI